MRKIALVVILVFCYSKFSREQTTSMQFEHFNVQQGLSQSWVTSICQDYLGFLWFGTGDGLNRFDGYSFKVYKHNPKSIFSLRNNGINKIIEYNKQIWLATSTGLCKFNRANENFYYDSLWPETYVSDLKYFDNKIIVASNNGLYYLDLTSNKFNRFRIKNSPVLADLIINCLAIDSGKNLWVGTTQGLFVLSENFSTVTKINGIGNKTIPSALNVSSLVVDSKKSIWAGTENNGVYLIVVQDSGFNHLAINNYRHSDLNKQSINEGMIRSVMEDRIGRIWFGIENGGLDILSHDFSTDKPVFHHYVFDPKNESGISSNSIYAIFQDLRGDIWLGTYGGGINYYINSGKNFTCLRHLPEEPNSLINNNVNIFYKHDGKIWIGTEGGISIFNIADQGFTNYSHNPNKANSLTANAVWTIEADNDNTLWIGTWAGGVCLNDGKSSSFKPFKPQSLPNNNIFWIYQDSGGYIWICTMGGGLVRYNKADNSFTYFQNDPDNPKSIADNWAQLIYENSRKELWVSTTTSLELFDRKNQEFIHFKSKIFDTNSFSGRGAQAIYEDSKHNMWFGTDAGLNLFIRSDSTFRVYQESDGLPNNSIKGILEDKHGNLWLSTNKGIAKMIDAVNLPKKPKFKNYDERDGLQGNEFNRRAAFEDDDGTMYFGGTDGFNYFKPDSINENKFVPPVVLTNFLVANKPVVPALKNSPISRNISIADTIILKYSQTVFTIEFAALNFINSDKNEYSYKLEGFDKEWNNIGNKRTANYTNVDPGEYTFRVRASNNDEIWNNRGAGITVIILPPWYRTVWAYAVYAVFLIFLIYIFRRFILIRAYLQHEIKVKQIEKERADELYQMKTRFYTNISHEFRTPLTLIIGPLEKLMGNINLKGEIDHQFEVMLKNARRMLRLINQFMDMSKIEAGYVKMIVHEGDLAKYISAIAEIFDYQASDKQIQFVYSSNKNVFNAWFDSDKIEKILYNLLSNAIKYTPHGGKVEFKVKYNSTGNQHEYPGFAEFWIKDTGMGINEEDRKKIFDRFYQAENNKNIKQPGTGIGLSLAQGLVQKYGGYIDLKSELEKGTEFYFRLPYTRDKFDDSWIVTKTEEEYLGKLEAEYAQTSLAENPVHIENTGPEPTDGLPVLLIVEDNIDLIQYISGHFKHTYKILQALNGEEGIKMAVENMPDIIVSDIMMPGTDGMELCRTLKKEIKTSHIPIILLTAKASDETQVEGLETGADEFLAKPFNITVLEARIKNLLESRQKLKELFSQKINIEPKEIAITSIDAIFIQKAMNLVEKHMSDAEFNVDQMSREIGMSRASLHRKMIALTDLPPSGFIRAMRLKRSARLLVEGQHTVSEVLYMVGIKSRSYFTKSFKEMFGMSPTEYVMHFNSGKEHKKDFFDGLQ